MSKIIFSSKEKIFIENNYLSMSSKMIAAELKVNRGVIQRYLKKNKLLVPREILNQFKIDGINKRHDQKKHYADEIIIAEYLKTPIKTLANKIGRSDSYVKGRIKKLKLNIPESIIEQRKIDSRIKKGNIPANKGIKQSNYMSPEMIERTKATRFKKGQIPHNAIGFKDGDIVIRHSHKKRNCPPYKWIRIGKGKWEMYHVYLWKQHNGQIPDGHIIVFKDKNTMNVIIENLDCITKKENMMRNSIHQYPEEIKKTIQTLSLITRKINRHEKQNQ